ncbi:sigma-70 family RNA polymerase sigma factor [Sediminibacillus massiliensis]|uniref:sigma-70 family RNA polymerase sigma factor n=1 Tax=Sediminibacillus massiliensis TaxID=1926277 RepID=UPI0009889323|nr:sigma-70 family RNA polymerase sigma factor [Sediminibacillus massiliensis]
MNETKLARKAVKGNQKALEELLVAHGDQLYRTAFIYTRNREDALDVVQEASYRAFRYIGNLKNEEFFLTWLTKILIHCAYDLLERKNKEIPNDKLIELARIKKDKREEHLDLVEAVGRLEDKYRDVIILFYFRDLRINDIARMMEIPENTVKTYMRRAKAQLKKQLGGCEYNDERLFSRRV